MQQKRSPIENPFAIPLSSDYFIEDKPPQKLLKYDFGDLSELAGNAPLVRQNNYLKTKIDEFCLDEEAYTETKIEDQEKFGIFQDFVSSQHTKNYQQTVNYIYMNVVCKYYGELNNEKLPHGYGKLYSTIDNLQQLEGQFNNGNIEGKVIQYEYIVSNISSINKGVIYEGSFVGFVQSFDGNNMLKEIGKMKHDFYVDKYYGFYHQNGKINFRGGKSSSRREGFGVEYYNNGQISYVGDYENDFYKTKQQNVGYILNKTGNLLKRFENIKEDEVLQVYDMCLEVFLSNWDEEWSNESDDHQDEERLLYL